MTPFPSWTLDMHGVVVAMRVLFGAAGAPTLQAWNNDTQAWQSAAVAPYNGGFMGIASIVRNSTGDYTITFVDAWARYYWMAYNWEGNAGLPTAPFVGVTATALNGASGSTIEIVTSSGGTPTDPASGDILCAGFALSDYLVS